MKQNILIIEDEMGISSFICAILSSNGYQPLVARNGTQGTAMLYSAAPDLVLLDLGLPDMDGVELIRQVRQWSSIPIIVVSARGREADKVQALDLGADDYITKPFGSSELLTRIRTALRHVAADRSVTQDRQLVQVKELKVDLGRRQVFLKGKEVHLTQIEYKILELLCRNVGKVLTYEFMLRSIWGPYSISDNQILRVNMANIRRKLEENPADPSYIRTELGVGYRLLDTEE